MTKDITDWLHWGALSPHGQMLWRLSMDYDGIIAGGFLRDKLLGKQPKDIDIVVPVTDNIRAKWQTPQWEPSNPDYVHPHLVKTQVLHLGLEWPINLLYWQFPHDCRSASSRVKMVMDYIDIGLCKIAYSAHTGVQMHDLFKADVLCKRMTVTRTDWGLKGVAAHYTRLKEKYPDYTLQFLQKDGRITRSCAAYKDLLDEAKED